MTRHRNNSIIAQIRDVSPGRMTNYTAATRVAEAQAERFLSLTGLTGPPFPSGSITGLPRIEVAIEPDMPVSGSTLWHGSRWLIVLRRQDPIVRRRFTLAHEFKHVIDHQLGGGLLYLQGPARDRTEELCDFFAASLLMPRAWVQHAWTVERLHSLPALAERFHVSVPAMARRLSFLDLGERTVNRYEISRTTDALSTARAYQCGRGPQPRYERQAATPRPWQHDAVATLRPLRPDEREALQGQAVAAGLGGW